ncbi:tRNA (adenosine(37)-N6)-threonylcarbamoyltransferase complex dimerization subunit type 1 TsaB [Corynebacterium guaraldiae]|uniref:tRNA (Adenosine(37)-N6)-threonylcarbamoyltransferase complex dimerization subunit type 1 TsaB n=1 Tax=Corynebacterium guaraldiae TaxID=3051103 RepID=A0ABY3CX11_9CORY|nr:MULTISPECIES: tRNA (adenosine(37)-N6)-threonylcarbamoyltransferase complex dimerization subunit type 1 TsaB [Corynebacterium]OFK67093.1 tRNA threonylcarbamoyladenosine biosynthesis protein TsaB [Corynebacterium sp. HMSC076G08]OFN76673.1 tRNA threonylcarbamoyladenosine biosynthesis protein TsaB [Corynebacterium sp. HMSC074E01]OHO61629.1 tRNA threonylcarbamoyladenosine biosynthesis protein TsaB [Corynebacterium sp. HMSC036D02]TRX51115.1 tRNA (adenosine(37)-N6)-threonylcarbamoyltransferase comp
MKVLALDTATTDLVTGIVDTDTGESIDRVISGTRAHNEQLIPTIEELLADASLTYADLSAIVVGTGPGPFTGLRVGMATASALGVALHLPVHGVCTLDAIAHGRTGEWLVAIDARRKEVYWATYVDGERRSGPNVSKPETLDLSAAGLASPASALLVFPESIAPRLPEDIADLPSEWATPRAEGLVACADLSAEPEPLVPLYLRRPDAVEPKAKPRSAALVGGNEETPAS